MASKKNPHRDLSLKDDPAVTEIPLACASEPHAVEFLEAMRGWDTNPYCARCGSVNVYQMSGRDGSRNARFLWRCRDCSKHYTVRADTVMEDSRIPLRHWVLGFWRVCSSKKGVSALEIRRQTGITHKSALFMLHRIRWALADDNTKPLGGFKMAVEADETFVGGKPRHKGTKRNPRQSTKVPVMAVVERGGNVHLQRIPRVTARHLGKVLYERTDPRSVLCTDEHPSYKSVGKHFSGGHYSTNHSAYEYARGPVHSNTAESVFALLKRGLHGIFHSVSKHHLHRYLAEFQFRWNTRDIRDSERLQKAVKASVGKRLRYAESAP